MALFGTMVVLAAIPSLSVLTVVARTTTHGFTHGVATSFGIVCGDLIYIAIALFGLGFIAPAMQSSFDLLRYFGAIYLLYLAWCMARASASSAPIDSIERGHIASYTAGLLLTLADHKAILFYIVLFPAFLDVNNLAVVDIALICVVTMIAVGGVKILYAWLASRSIQLLSVGKQLLLNRLAAFMLVIVAIMLLLSAGIMS